MDVTLRNTLGRLGTAVALAAAMLALAACGPAAPPAEDAPTATHQPAAASSGDSSSGPAQESEPQGDLAPKFTLPSASGDSVSLDSFAGDRNVVLVFYRGFW